MAIKRVVTVLVASSVAAFGLTLTASTASADPGGAPCYGNTQGLFIKDKGRSGDFLWADVLNCGPSHGVTLDVSLAPDPPCRTIKRGESRVIRGWSHGGGIRKAKYC
ncbi:hypothetical protein HII36_17800 [Nonomuraea sp. NN258]|uniref:hypothetical protein n=1 Tax=Nonomuraea antri TaxID=2730852 RepID=UPI001569FCDB|nr:hypothetical protein [Nonomuraea antri]NRQ33690.1 hypothetical protein [Nonomuraea antri]